MRLRRSRTPFSSCTSVHFEGTHRSSTPRSNDIGQERARMAKNDIAQSRIAQRENSVTTRRQPFRVGASSAEGFLIS